MAQHGGRAHVPRVEQVFDGQRHRLGARDPLLHALVDRLQARWESVVGACANDAALDERGLDHRRASTPNDAVACDRATGVDPENHHGGGAPVYAPARSGTSISKLASTFWTSSRSSSSSSSLISDSAVFPSTLTVFLGTHATSASAVRMPRCSSAAFTA